MASAKICIHTTAFKTIFPEDHAALNALVLLNNTIPFFKKSKKSNN